MSESQIQESEPCLKTFEPTSQRCRTCEWFVKCYDEWYDITNMEMTEIHKLLHALDPKTAEKIMAELRATGNW
jgi:hypothetical protein